MCSIYYSYRRHDAVCLLCSSDICMIFDIDSDSDICMDILLQKLNTSVFQF